MHAESPPPQRSAWLIVLFSSWTLANVGYFSIQAMLALYLFTTLQLPAGLAGLLMLLTTLSARLTRFFFAPLIERMPPHVAMVLALSLSALSALALSALDAWPITSAIARQKTIATQ